MKVAFAGSVPVVSSIFAIALAVPGYTSAQALEEVIVTAQKREQSVMEIPIAVSAFSGEELDRMGFKDTRDMTELVPSLHISDSFNGNVSTTLRGLENSVSYYADGVYLQSNTSVITMNYDVERFEVLRGPQGTLYGKDSSGGTINIINRKPTDEIEAKLDVGFGNYDSWNVKGMGNLPVTDTFRVRGVFAFDRRDSYETNRGSIDEFGNPISISGKACKDGYATRCENTFRVSGLWEPRDDLSWYGSVTYFYSQGNPTLFGNLRPVDPDGDERNEAHVGTDLPRFDQTLINYSQRIDWDMTDTVRFSWLGGWTQEDLNRNRSGTAVTTALVSRSNHENEFYNTEIQFQSTGTSRFQWTVGAFFAMDTTDSRVDQQFYSPALNRILFGNINWTAGDSQKSWAFFNQNTYAVTDSLRLTAGVRFTKDKKWTEDNHRDTIIPVPGNTLAQNRDTSVIPFTSPSVRGGDEWTNTSWKAAVEWDWSDNSMVYASVSTGYKSGGFSLSSDTSFDEENLVSYEIGSKNTLLDGRLQLSVTGYIYDYQDFQGSEIIPDPMGVGGSLISVTSNAANATVQGVEVEYNWQVTENARIQGHVSWLDAFFDEYNNAPADAAFLNVLGMAPVDLTGGDLEKTPEWETSITGIYDYRLPNGASITPAVTWSWTDSQFLRIYSKPIDQQGPWSNLDASVRYRSADDRWYVEGFVKNATDELVRDVTFQAGPNTYTTSHTAPRTYGFRAGYNFF